MLASLPMLKNMLGLPDTEDDDQLVAIILTSESTLREHYSDVMPTVPKVTQTRTVHVGGTWLQLHECNSITKVEDLEEQELEYSVVPGKLPTDHLRGVRLTEELTGFVKVTGEWGYDATPLDVVDAVHATVRMHWRRMKQGDGGNDFIGRLNDIPQEAHDRMRARRRM